MAKRHSLWEYFPELLVRYNSGETSYEIAKSYGVSRCLVTSILKSSGTKLRRSGKVKGCPAWNKGKVMHQLQGDKNPRWKGGITPLNQVVRHLPQYREWIDKVFKRDNYVCVLCKNGSGSKEADHYPKKFCEIMESIKSQDEAIACKEMWDVNNGRTLCLPCHNRTKQVKSRFKKWSNKLQNSLG